METNKSPEQRAREYAESVVDESVENYIGDEIYDSHIEYASQCYLSGYNQAVTDLSTSNTELREALVALHITSEDAINTLKYILNTKDVDFSKDYIASLERELDRAKTLIND